jgi:hypothetical protein
MTEETQELTPEQAEIAAKMDQATQELTSFITYLCDKYTAEFVVQKVLFTFVPRFETPQLSEDKADE